VEYFPEARKLWLACAIESSQQPRHAPTHLLPQSLFPQRRVLTELGALLSLQRHSSHSCFQPLKIQQEPSVLKQFAYRLA
jgi:hypothetical protein